MIRGATIEDWPALEEIDAEVRQWEGYCMLVLECDSRLAGFLVTRKVDDAEFEILEVAVDPAFRRRGLAATLLRHKFSESPGTYFLEVRESNHNALSLYRRLGFEAIGFRRDYYENPREHGIVMRFLS